MQITIYKAALYNVVLSDSCKRWLRSLTICYTMKAFERLNIETNQFEVL